MYRLLGLHPGADIERYAATALVGTTAEHAGRLLDDLVDVHLLQEPVPGRYRFHDLPRAHATATVGEDGDQDRRTALTRLFDHYIRTATAAMTTAHSHGSGRAQARRAATEWLDAELVNLLATAVHAARHGWPAHALDLSATLHRHLHERARYSDARTLHRSALQAAREISSRDRELAALCDLGDGHLAQGRFGSAAEYFERALMIAYPIGNRDELSPRQ
jgi:hypothetical protein